MRVLVVILAAAVSLLAQAGVQAGHFSGGVVADGATQYWRLGESSGSTAVNLINPGTNDGTYTGGHTLGQTGALIDDTDTAVDVDTSGYVSVGSLGALATTGSIEFWVNADSATGGFRNAFSTSGAAGGNEGFRFEVSSFGFLSVRVGNDAAASTGYDLAGPGGGLQAFTAGQWNYVVATWDTAGNTLTAYFNGSKVIDAAAHTQWATNLSDVEIGRGFDASAIRSWNGLVDEVAIYNGAPLSDAQVLARYNTATIAIPEPSAIILTSLGTLGLVAIGRRRSNRGKLV